MLRNKSLEKLILILEFREKKFALENGKGKSKSLYWDPRERFKNGGNLYVKVPPIFLILPLKNWPILPFNLIEKTFLSDDL